MRSTIAGDRYADPNREVAAAGTSMFVAQVLTTMAYADKQVALTMFQDVFVPYIEYFVKTINPEDKTYLRPQN